ncbi:NAD-dependent protein deacetylase sirtuin-4 [Fasciola hepatica]|uniref:NAD-dependent protein deacetylase sirtuin-4 n=1 Tax=Fasciola hepatica TaxID=6192 RepID=A0A2H1CDY2_FASHE|nr:NAD-dependent protein deacetylase sirtuin-4 [Fasciola hepatica]
MLLAKHTLALTGAGMSTESGLPDYRSEGVGLYARTDRRPIDYQSFISNEKSRQRYWARNFVGWPYFSRVRPNFGHHQLARWFDQNKISFIITQNVDRLHHQAGPGRILELHGNSHFVICLGCGHRISRVELQQRLVDLNPDWKRLLETNTDVAPDGDMELRDDLVNEFQVPSCPKCTSGVLKPDVVFFGENLPPERKIEAASWVDCTDLILCLGSSLQTFSSYRLLLQAHANRIPIVIVNIGPTRADSLASLVLNAKISDTLGMVHSLIS